MVGIPRTDRESIWYLGKSNLLGYSSKKDLDLEIINIKILKVSIPNS